MNDKPGSLAINYASHKTLLGYMLIARNTHGVFSVELGDNETELTQSLLATYPAAIKHQCDTLTTAFAQLQQYLTTQHTLLTFPLDLQGTDFQKKVWRAIAKIPYGKTVTYHKLAAQIGSPQSARALANACGQNKLALVIPCHRVVRQDGMLTGFRWGIDRKKTLLRLEQND